VIEYVESLITDDKGLIMFIKHFLSDVRSHGMSDYVESIQWRINLESIETFVDLNEVDKRLRKVRSSTEFKELEEKEQLAINIFLDTLDGNIDDLSRF